MDNYLLAACTAFWLGILTSISPCPLATNIAAISFIGKKIDKGSATILSGILYTAGRTAAYLLVALLILTSILTVPALARFLQKYVNVILGPLLIIVGIVLTEIFSLTFSDSKIIGKLQNFASGRGIAGTLILGFVFALAFCPISAALFFGSLIPLSVKYDSSVMMPVVYGVGTAFPVVLISIALAFGTRFIGILFDNLTKFEWWAQRITGIAFICIGIYLSFKYIF